MATTLLFVAGQLLERPLSCATAGLAVSMSCGTPPDGLLLCSIGSCRSDALALQRACPEPEEPALRAVVYALERCPTFRTMATGAAGAIAAEQLAEALQQTAACDSPDFCARQAWGDLLRSAQDEREKHLTANSTMMLPSNESASTAYLAAQLASLAYSPAGSPPWSDGRFSLSVQGECEDFDVLNCSNPNSSHVNSVGIIVPGARWCMVAGAGMAVLAFRGQAPALQITLGTLSAIPLRTADLTASAGSEFGSSVLGPDTEEASNTEEASGEPNGSVPWVDAETLIAWRGAAPSILDALASLPPHLTLLITGHGFGGSVATLSAFELAAAMLRGELEERPIELVTFGRPRVGGQGWAAAAAQLLALENTPLRRTARYTTATDVHVDLVSAFPPAETAVVINGAKADAFEWQHEDVGEVVTWPCGAYGEPLDAEFLGRRGDLPVCHLPRYYSTAAREAALISPDFLHHCQLLAADGDVRPSFCGDSRHLLQNGDATSNSTTDSALVHYNVWCERVDPVRPFASWLKVVLISLAVSFGLHLVGVWVNTFFELGGWRARPSAAAVWREANFVWRGHGVHFFDVPSLPSPSLQTPDLLGVLQTCDAMLARRGIHRPHVASRTGGDHSSSKGDALEDGADRGSREGGGGAGESGVTTPTVAPMADRASAAMNVDALHKYLLSLVQWPEEEEPPNPLLEPTTDVHPLGRGGLVYRCRAAARVARVQLSELLQALEQSVDPVMPSPRLPLVLGMVMTSGLLPIFTVIAQQLSPESDRLYWEISSNSLAPGMGSATTLGEGSGFRFVRDLTGLDVSAFLAFIVFSLWQSIFWMGNVQVPGRWWILLMGGGVWCVVFLYPWNDDFRVSFTGATYGELEGCDANNSRQVTFMCEGDEDDLELVMSRLLANSLYRYSFALFIVGQTSAVLLLVLLMCFRVSGRGRAALAVMNAAYLHVNRIMSRLVPATGVDRIFDVGGGGPLGKSSPRVSDGQASRATAKAAAAPALPVPVVLQVLRFAIFWLSFVFLVGCFSLAVHLPPHIEQSLKEAQQHMRLFDAQYGGRFLPPSARQAYRGFLYPLLEALRGTAWLTAASVCAGVLGSARAALGQVDLYRTYHVLFARLVREGSPAAPYDVPRNSPHRLYGLTVAWALAGFAVTLLSCLVFMATLNMLVRDWAGSPPLRAFVALLIMATYSGMLEVADSVRAELRISAFTQSTAQCCLLREARPFLRF